MNNVHFSSNTDQWSTPKSFFDLLSKEFKFDVDVCADSKNKKCRKYFSEKQDGLKQDWKGLVCWMNPPYGREIGKWVEKAARGGRRQWCVYYPHGLIRDGFTNSFTEKRR